MKYATAMKILKKDMEFLVCNKCNNDELGQCPNNFEYKGYDAWCFYCEAPTNKVLLQFGLNSLLTQEERDEMTGGCPFTHGMTNFDKGEYDAVHGHDARKNQHPDYYSGYGEEYSRQQNADALTTLQTIGL